MDDAPVAVPVVVVACHWCGPQLEVGTYSLLYVPVLLQPTVRRHDATTLPYDANECNRVSYLGAPDRGPLSN